MGSAGAAEAAEQLRRLARAVEWFQRRIEEAPADPKLRRGLDAFRARLDVARESAPPGAEHMEAPAPAPAASEPAEASIGATLAGALSARDGAPEAGGAEHEGKIHRFGPNFGPT